MYDLDEAVPRSTIGYDVSGRSRAPRRCRGLFLCPDDDVPAPQSWPLLTTPEDHAQALHPGGLGRVSIARRHAERGWRETSVPVAELGYAVRQLAGEPDVYLTQN